ncbi:MAG: hypothetical protein ABSF80_11895 [Chitinispirillaceae bacterium]|jgi:hypothetical protein
MIRINLLKGASPRLGRSAVPVALLIRIGIAVVAGLVIIVVGAGLMRWFLARPHTGQNAVVATAPQPAPEKNVAPEKPTAVVPLPAPEKKAASEKAKPAPENKTILEPPAQSPVEPTPYQMQSHSEKVNYEIAFTNKVLQTLTNAVFPKGVEFSSLSIDSFTTVSAKGFKVSKENVNAIFKNLRRERFELLEPPLSFIEPDPVRDFDFQFTGTVLFNADSAGAFQPAGHLVPAKNLQSMVTTFLKTAAGNRLIVRHGLVRKAAATSDEFRQFVYHCSCSGAFRDFVKFVLEVNKAHLPCAFTAVQIKVRTKTVIDVSTDIIFTTRK